MDVTRRITPVLCVYALFALTINTTYDSIIQLHPSVLDTDDLVGQVSISMQVILCSMTLWSFLRAQMSDPGVIPLGLKPPANIRNSESCKACGGWKPPRAHHSRRIKRCVFRMDHVCHWINNVVGYSNQKYFVLFLFYSTISCVFNVFVLGTFFWSTSFANGLATGDFLKILSILINVVSGIVLKDFLSEQIESIESNVTLIETFQNCHGDDSVDVFRQIFGPNPALWLIPIHTTAPPNYSEIVFSERRLSATDADSLGVELTSKLESNLDAID